MKLNDKRVFYRSPGKGTLVYGNSCYVRARGVEKICRRSIEIKNDLIEATEFGRSSDNGRTWSPLLSEPVMEKTLAGMRRWAFALPWVDPVADRLLEIANESVLPNDDALEAMERNFLRYRVSLDGGRTYAVDEVAVQKGPYTPDHPFDGVWIGKNSVMLGDLGSQPIRTRGGRILLPVQMTPIGPDGTYYNPGGGYTYHDAAVLIGRWLDGGRIEWDLSEYIRNDPARSTRGCIEPTVVQVPDGRILMVLRGSNDAKPHLPGYRWHSVSEDEGRTWSPVRPWTYDDGAPFFSPSSMSQLLPHSNGALYWLGNICSANPKGNSPRYPLVIGEVDPARLTLIRDSIFTIDDRQPGEPEVMTLSNFCAHEDRETAEIVLHMSRWFIEDWIGHAYIYRIGV
jgi:hypothetical protein